MVKCKNCKFWKRKPQPESKRYGEQAGDCSCEKFKDISDHGQIKKDELGCYDWESYKASFVTGEDFGCVHGKQKRAIK